MLYYEDRWTGSIYTLAELARLIEACEVPRYRVTRRFRLLPEPLRRVIYEAALVADRADRECDRRSA